jgi:hypothetical protein
LFEKDFEEEARVEQFFKGRVIYNIFEAVFGEVNK